MTIASAILALGPALYWKLDQTTGTVAVDSSAGGRNGTASGDFQWGVTGAEIGGTGVRLYAGSSIIGPGMGLNAFTTWSLMFFATCPAAGGVATPQRILGLGDYANPTVRGIYVQASSTAQDSLLYRMRGSTQLRDSNAPWPVPYWHHLCWTYTNTPSASWTPYVDGGIGTALGSAPGTAWQAIDPLYLVGNTAIVVAHVAFFTRTLTQLEIQSVASQIQPWPYQVPSNQIPTGGGGDGGGGLTPEQADQLSAIETNTDATLPIVTAMQTVLNTVKTGVDQILGYWNGYETVTLPSLSEVLGNIQSSVTSTVGGGADTVQKTIGELFSTNPVDSLLTADLSEGVTCDRIDLDVGLGGLYGIVLYITTVPDDWEFRTPDNAWGLKDLAVIRVTRGGHLILRHGVHTTSHTISPLPELQLPWIVTALGVPTTPADYRISVDFAAGVCGRLEGLFLP